MLTLLLLALPGFAADVAGRWEGEIALPTGGLEVQVELRSGDDGWTGEIDIPAQGAKDLPLVDIRVEGAAVSFVIKGVPGTPTFTGRATDEPKRQIAGDFTQGGAKLAFSLDFVTAELSPSPTDVARSGLDGFDTFVNDAMKEWEVPGLALAIVVRGEVVHRQGYGVRKLGDDAPVTTETLFAIGSSTKAFTTTVLGTLVDEGRLDWDDKVRDHIPWFTLHDELATARVTPRDLVTHRTGLPRHDLLWYNTSRPREEYVRAIAFLEPNEDFRAVWQYQNLMFLTAGFLAEQITGETWEDLVRRRIFEPAAMKSSGFSVAEMQRTPNYASPHADIDGEVQPVAFRDITAIGPAGSINSNLDDMTRWVRLQLEDGELDGKRIIEASTLAEIHRAQVAMPGSADEEETPMMSYAMGWMVQPWRGHHRIHHGGNIDGFSALVSFNPHDDVGMVVLTNKNGTPLPEIVMRHAMDRVLGLEVQDWNSELRKRYTAVMAAADASRDVEDPTRKKKTKPTYDLDEYPGTYSHPGYGTLTVERTDKKRLALTYNDITSEMAHYHYDVFALNPTDPVLKRSSGLLARFQPNDRGEVGSVSVPWEPTVDPIVFTRDAPARMSDPKWLARFVGKYDMPTVQIEVKLRGTDLLIGVPGQGDTKLVPYRDTRFTFEDTDIATARFEMDGDVVRELQVILPGAVQVAKPAAVSP